MKSSPSLFYLLPKNLRIKLVIAFSLMAIIPVLGNIYLATLYTLNINIEVFWIKLTLITFILIIIAGFIIVWNCVWEIINIAKTIDKSLSESQKVSTQEFDFLKFEHLILYMEDQIRLAKRILNNKRKNINYTPNFKLPTLIPASLIKKRFLQESAQAALNQTYITVFVWQTSNISKKEYEDDTLIPKWLVTLLKKNSLVRFESIGRIKPGWWIAWNDYLTTDDINMYKENSNKIINDNNLNDIKIKIFHYPSKNSDFSFLNNNDVLEID